MKERPYNPWLYRFTATDALPMPPLSPLDQITERVELLMERHAQLQRSNALLAAQVATLSMERDSLQSRLRAARTRVDLLVDRLAEAEAAAATAPATATATPEEPAPLPAAATPSAEPAEDTPLPLKEDRT